MKHKKHKKNQNKNNNNNNNNNNTHVKILLDSGASASIVNNSYGRGNRTLRITSTHTWSIMAGTFNTSSIT